MKPFFCVLLLFWGTAYADSSHPKANAAVPRPIVSMEGTVLHTFPYTTSVMIAVRRIVDATGRRTLLNPPRTKRIICTRLQDESLMTPQEGQSVAVTGRDYGQGEPMIALALRLVEETDTLPATMGTMDSPNRGEADERALIEPRSRQEMTDSLPLDSVHHVFGFHEGISRPDSGISHSHGVVLHGGVSHSGVNACTSIALPDGTKVEGRRMLRFVATGYGPGENGEWGDQTFKETTVGEGTVAVDPKIIPLGTHLWVEGYGFCIALDVGSAIKGKRIDLGFNDDITANNYGRKAVRILILN